MMRDRIQVCGGGGRWIVPIANRPQQPNVPSPLPEATAGFKAALWTLVGEDDGEPTNNSAERPLRRAVLWRRRSFGTQSEAGSQFVERILTVVTTLRQQQRAVLAYLTAACTARLQQKPPPALMPPWRPIPAAA